MVNLRLLLADPDSSFRTNAQHALARQGYTILPAATAADALGTLEKEPVDVLVADVGLAQSDSVDLLRAARSRSPSLPVILLAEPRALAAAAAGVRRGAFDYVLKPVYDFSRLSLLVDRAAARPTIAPVQQQDENRIVEHRVADSASGRFLAAAVAGEDVNQLLSLYALELSQLAHAPQVIVLRTGENAQFQVVASHGYVDRAEAARVYAASGCEDLAWRVLQAREPIWDNAGQALQGQSEVKGLLGLPLTYGGRGLGVGLALTALTRLETDEATMDAVRILTQEASLAVEVSRSRELADQRNAFDPVTGLLTSAHFFELAEREFRRCWRFGEPLGVMELDVDDFRRVPLLLGPRGGDEVMQQVACAVRPRVRSIDLVGRLDQDKVGIIVLKGTRETTPTVGERLRRGVAEIELATPEGPWQVTASIGIATYPREQCASVHDLFALAAQATRAAKRAGRNRVVSV